MSKRPKGDKAGVAYRKSLNETFICKNPRCSRMRVGLSAYCVKCRGRNTRTGSVTGRTIQKHEYRNEYLEAEQFLETNREHPAVLAAIQFITSWIDSAILRRTVPGRAHLIHLYDSGVTPLQIVHEILAISLFSYRNQGKLPFGEPFKVALAYSVFRLAGTFKKERYSAVTGKNTSGAVSFSGGLRRKVGQFLRDNLWTFIGNAIESMQKTMANHEALQLAMSTSFNRTKSGQPSAGKEGSSSDDK